MIEFYASIIFIGIILIIGALISIFIDRSKYKNIEKSMGQKKDELTEIIADANEMIEELNKFSTHIVTQIELKNQELLSNLEQLQKHTELARQTVQKDSTPLKKEEKKLIQIKSQNQEEKDYLLIDNVYFKNIAQRLPESTEPPREKNSKVVALSSKHKQVLELSKKGLSDIEIAKNLNIGKGEVQLIRGINR